MRGEVAGAAQSAAVVLGFTTTALGYGYGLLTRRSAKLGTAA